MNMLYSHRQANPFLWAVISLGMVGAIIAVLLDHKPWLILPIVAVFGVMLLLFSALTIEVSGYHLRFWYGVGIIRWTIPLGEIERVARSRSSWYEGWGIRLTLRGWLYNLSGLDCIEIQRSNGRSFRLGTPEPDRLINVLHTALATRRPAPPAA